MLKIKPWVLYRQHAHHKIAKYLL